MFSPTSLSVRQGVTITVSNVGTVQHTLTITGKGIDVVNNPGQTQSVAINLAPGTYQYICSIHPFMHGTVTVTGSGSQHGNATQPQASSASAY